MSTTPHFEGKDALSHVLSKKSEGASQHEVHGSEMPGFIMALADSSRESALLFVLLFILCQALSLPFLTTFYLLFSFGLGLLAWKTGRSAWLGFSRLERLHRLIEQEKYEIEHHRVSEREELSALYKNKGFDGKLLEDVVDVLMADQDRLLKVMLEEEMGLTLEVYEHPLKQASGAFLGVLISAAICFSLYFWNSSWGLGLGALLVLSGGAFLSALREKNRLISALIWNLSLGILSSGITYFIFHHFLSP